ncbi:MAG TPA: class I SAM-dependent methyltransferase [Vicinamibacterales bacterium]|nr:class I SAM-dependent methyltransferase [Vicinamibacterales bacterium]
MRGAIKRALTYRGLAETEPVRAAIAASRRGGWPYCAEDEGDFLFQLARSTPGQDALEVGFATGSTAAYILLGLGAGQLTSIDYDQNHFERAGVALIAGLGLAHRHRLIEQDSVKALPALDNDGDRYGLVFLDGWKTFDRMWVDTFYCVRMLNVGGFIVFDDAQMPAVRKCVSLLMRYYGFSDRVPQGPAGGWTQRLRYLMTTRSPHRPYVALRKTVSVSDSDAGRRYDFWKPF